MSDLSALVEALRPRRTALAVLWAACTVKCKRRVLVPEDVQYGFGDYYHPPTCSSCGGTGRVPRDVGEWPCGAVAGMLSMALWSMAWTPLIAWAPIDGAYRVAMYRGQDPDASALAAVLEAVRAVPEDGDAAGETK